MLLPHTNGVTKVVYSVYVFVCLSVSVHMGISIIQGLGPGHAPSPTYKFAVADPGFPRGGDANSPGGCQHTILPNFPKNCMKLKEFGPPGGRPKFYYVDPPLVCSVWSPLYGDPFPPLLVHYVACTVANVSSWYLTEMLSYSDTMFYPW